MKISAGIKWVFAEDLKGAPIEVQFIEAKQFINKEGRYNGEVLCFLGKEGDYQCFPGRISNIREVIKALGDETAAWSGKLFRLMSDDGNSIQMKLI